MKRSFSHSFLIICLVFLGITGCDIIEKLKGDYSKSSGPPVLPDLQLVQPNIDFFTTEFTEQALEDTSGYELATLLVKKEFNPFAQSIYKYLPFLDGLNETDPESIKGGWEWEYTLTYQSQNYDIRVVTERKDDTHVYYVWTLFMTTSPQVADPLTNYKYMELVTHEDEGGGYWAVYLPELRNNGIAEDLNPYLSLTWEFYNEDNKEYYYELRPYDLNSNEQIFASYTVDKLSDFKFHSYITMYIENKEFEVKRYNTRWNNNSKEGSVSFSHDIEPGMGGPEINKTICWDGNLNDIECQF